MTTGTRPASEELFVIPRGGDRYYLYAPLRRSVALVNRAVVDAVARYLDDGCEGATQAQETVLRTLKHRGFLGEPGPLPPSFPSDYPFCPHEVTLFLTSRCNLRCRYCYADAGHKAIDMPWEIAEAAIDLVATNAGLLGASKFGVGFHGGGEPTMAWRLLVQCVGHAREKADQTGLDCEIYAATNGVLSRAQSRFLAREFTSVNVSLDGPPDVQDFNRPMVNGRGSFRAVARTLESFDREGLHYGVRATVTSEMVERLEEIVEWLSSRFQLSYLHLEPVWACGRCTWSGEKPPAHEAFVTNFVRAAKRGRDLGVAVTYSGSRLDVLTSKFCAAPGDGFSVLPEGIVTSCYEVTETSDARASIFHYGRFDAKEHRFAFDDRRVAALRGHSVDRIPFCRDCFCKWHCAGDCLAKAFECTGSETHEGTTRCDLNRALTLAHLDELVSAESSAAASPQEVG